MLNSGILKMCCINEGRLQKVPQSNNRLIVVSPYAGNVCCMMGIKPPYHFFYLEMGKGKEKKGPAERQALNAILVW